MSVIFRVSRKFTFAVLFRSFFANYFSERIHFNVLSSLTPFQVSGVFSASYASRASLYSAFMYFCFHFQTLKFVDPDSTTRTYFLIGPMSFCSGDLAAYAFFVEPQFVNVAYSESNSIICSTNSSFTYYLLASHWSFNNSTALKITILYCTCC